MLLLQICFSLLLTDTRKKGVCVCVYGNRKQEYVVTDLGTLWLDHCFL